MYYGNSSAAAVSSIPNTFIGFKSSTDSLTGGTSTAVGSTQRGFRFYPNQDLLVTKFGKYEPDGTTRYITLFNFSNHNS